MNSIVLALLGIAIFGAGVMPVDAHTLNPHVVEQITGEQIADQKPATTTSADPRGEERTFASFPEWYIVYNAEEYADFVAAGGRPSQFPFFASIDQYWHSVELSSAALGETAIDSNTRTVLQFIGVSFTLENGLIGIYEKTIGYATEALNFYKKTDADTYTEAVAREYADFLVHTPWYGFPYFEKLPNLWVGDIFSLRGMERRTAFSIGYALKGAYGKVIGAATKSSLGTAELTTTFTVSTISEQELRAIPNVTVEAVHPDGHIQATAPRYRAFTTVARAVLNAGGEFVDIQGHDEIMVTVRAPAETPCLAGRTDIVLNMPILTSPELHRVALRTPVANLQVLTQQLRTCDIELEHIYDY